MSGSGLAVADNEDRATDLLIWAENGRKRIAEQITLPLAPFAVIEVSGHDLSPVARAALESAGYTVILEWLSPATVQQQIEENVARSVRQQMVAAGIEGEQLEEIVKSAVAQLAVQRTPGAVMQRDSIVVPHELAHKWLARAFWPDEAGRPGQYATPAPDWLDEMIALIAEPDHSHVERREQFWNLYRSDLLAGVEPRFADLLAFLAATHPMEGRMDRQSRGFTVQVFDTNDPAFKGVNPAEYYLQALLFWDFLRAQGLNDAVLNRLLVEVASGGSLEQFLATDGAHLGLPQTLAELAVRWRSWLAETERHLR